MNKDFDYILLTIRSVKGESKRQRRKVYKLVKKWRSENSYVPTDYSELRAIYQAQEPIVFIKGEYYTVVGGDHVVKEGNRYRNVGYLTDDLKGDTFYVGEVCEFLSQWKSLKSHVLSTTSIKATQEEVNDYKLRKTKIDSFKADRDRYFKLYQQSCDMIDVIASSK